MLAAMILLTPITVFAQSGATHEYRLKNGLKLVVREDHRAPVVMAQIWYKVGSSYEPGGITGISHALEHMMFRGTKRLPAGRLSRLVAENGGQENAFTASDFTAYYQNFPVD
jgi:zinc protease